MEDEEIPILEVNLIPGPESNPLYLNYTWSLTAQTETQISIQMNYENATAVSSNAVSIFID